MKLKFLKFAAFITLVPTIAFAQLVKKDDTTDRNYFNEDGSMRIAIAVQNHRPNPSGNTNLDGPEVMANGGIQEMLRVIGAEVRMSSAELSDREKTEYGNWRKMGYANGRYADNVMQNEADGYFTVGYMASCPSSLGMLGGFNNH
ncbi:MAG: hypothetical protein P8H03_07140 [Emcibacteraceae bacterium]|nr:hypothetical protein [Emcibacteraceae bacterium]